MPRVDFKLCNRLFILKVIATTQMTSSSFIGMLYLYLLLFDYSTQKEVENKGVHLFRWIALVVTWLDFGVGTLLAFAANMTGIRCRRRIVSWIILESLFIPISIFLLTQLYYKITKCGHKYKTYVHLLRITMAQICLISCYYVFVGYAVDFLILRPEVKEYDPSIRPETVDAPTDPQITTTESRHIRMCHSLLFQPSSSSKLQTNEENSNGSLNKTEFEGAEENAENEKEITEKK